MGGLCFGGRGRGCRAAWVERSDRNLCYAKRADQRQHRAASSVWTSEDRAASAGATAAGGQTGYRTASSGRSRTSSKIWHQRKRVCEIKGDEAQDQKIKLEPLARGIFISTLPPGADVFINGAKQAGQTPVTLPLAPGQYNLVLRLSGYEPYSGSIQVTEIQTPLNVSLTERSATRVAWAQVTSNPKGAEIIVDGNSTGQFTPARVQIPSGIHTITLKLDGYQLTRRTVQASEGGTVPINETLRQR